MCFSYINTVLHLVNFTSHLPTDFFTNFCLQVEVLVTSTLYLQSS